MLRAGRAAARLSDRTSPSTTRTTPGPARQALPGRPAARHQALPAQGAPERHLRRQEQADRRGRLRPRRGAAGDRLGRRGDGYGDAASTTSRPRSTGATRRGCSRPTPWTSTTCSCARSTSSGSSPSGWRYYRDLFRHVLVDEYQDTNRAQYLLVKLLTEEHRQVTVVGDDDQSVYSWRGADIRNILSFEDDFPDATVVKLEQNYRSTTTILEAANALVAHNRGRKPKNLWSDRGAGEPVVRARVPRRARGGPAGLRGDRQAAAGPAGLRRGRLLPGERPVAGARGHARAPGRGLPGDRRHQVLPAGGDQGPPGLPARGRQPHRRPLPARASSTPRGAGWAMWPSAGCRVRPGSRASRCGTPCYASDEIDAGAAPAAGAERRASQRWAKSFGRVGGELPRRRGVGGASGGRPGRSCWRRAAWWRPSRPSGRSRPRGAWRTWRSSSAWPRSSTA